MKLYTIAKIERTGREVGRVRVFAHSAEEAFVVARHEAGWSIGACLVVLQTRAA
jgi:hypothetical protein